MWAHEFSHLYMPLYSRTIQIIASQKYINQNNTTAHSEDSVLSITALEYCRIVKTII